MKLLSREDLLKKQELTVVKVDLGNDEFVCVREMTGFDRDNFEQSLVKMKTTIKDGREETTYEKANDNFRSKFAVCVICDEEGNALLRPEDYPVFAKNIGIKRLEKIVDEGMKLNNLSEKDKEDLLKNSKADREDNSSSDSAVNLE